MSLGFLKIGVEKGDKIAVISESRPEWNIVDFAVQHEQVKKIRFLASPRTVECGEITPTQKPKRKAKNSKYKAVIDRM